MLKTVFLFISLKCLFVSVYEIEKCRDTKSLYLLEDQVVEWANSVQGHVWINSCINETVVDEVLDPAMIVQYSYNELHLDNVIWPAMLDTAKTKYVLMRGVTPVGVWGGCSQLVKMEIYPPYNHTLMSPDWLTNCTQLVELRLSEVTVAQLRAIMDSASKLDYLAVYDIIDLESIVWDPMFPTAREAHNWITKIELSIRHFNDVETNNTSWMEVSEAFAWQLSLLPRLEEILILSFKNLDWCASVNYSTVKFPSVKKLWLQNTATPQACFRELRFTPNLRDLTLSVRHLQFSELLSTCAPQMHVQFVDFILFYREDYLMLLDCQEQQKSNVTFLYEGTIECDCSQSLWLTKALLQGFVTMTQVTCPDGTAIEDQSCDWLYCERVICNTTCICCDDTKNGVIADCRDANLTQIPPEVLSLRNLSEILIPNSNLLTLPKSFPSSLLFIDLYGNDLFQNVDESGIASLFAVPERIVRLAANSIVCHCDYEILIRQLQQFSSQIQDFDQLICAGQNGKLSEVDVALLCEARDRAATVLMVVTGALIAAVLSLILGLMLYYRRQIQIFLYARGWCQCCIDEEELDVDRRYDVFLSFCYADEDFVIKELLTALDRDYSVCVHFRDWNPGDMIPAQIWKSVGDSRRTLVVLSRNFIKSLWGLLEFRSAYVSGLTEGRVRVVMVILDDVLEDKELEGELRAYVRLNTYVKWGDPWFWDKLRFALPHRSASREPNNRNPDNYTQNYLVCEPNIIEMLALNAADNIAYEQSDIREVRNEITRPNSVSIVDSDQSAGDNVVISEINSTAGKKMVESISVYGADSSAESNENAKCECMDTKTNNLLSNKETKNMSASIAFHNDDSSTKSIEKRKKRKF